MTTWAETDWSASALTLLGQRTGYVVRHLLYLTVRNRSTGAAVPLGLSTDDEDTTYTLSAVARTYQGLQDHMVPPVLRFQPGTTIQRVSCRFVGLLPEVQEAALTYDAKLAPAEIHVALYDADMGLVAIRRRFKGVVTGAPFFTPPVNGVAEAEIEMVSSARRGTMTRSAKKSDEAQQARSGDRGRRYGVATGADWIGRRG